MTQKKPGKKLDDPMIRSTLLIAIAQGKPRARACELAGVSVVTLRKYEKENPEFFEQLLDAEEAAFDPVEESVRTMAIAGDISASKEYRTMKRRREAREARERKVEVETKHTHVFEIEDRLRELLGTLRSRRELEEVSMERESNA